jgi:flagellar motor switch protein FliN/FliY
MTGKEFIKIAAIDQMAYADYSPSILPPTSLMAVSAFNHGTRLPGRIVIGIHPYIMNELLYRWFDGSGGEQKRTISDHDQHRLTPIEKRTLRYYGAALVERYSDLLTELLNVSLHTKDIIIETDPGMLPAAELTDLVILVIVEIKIGDAEGTIDIVLPYKLLRSLLPLMDPCNFYKFRHFYDPTVKSKFSNYIPDLETELRAEAFRKLIPYGELRKKGTGSVIFAPGSCNKTDCFLMIGNTVLFKGTNVTDCLNPESTRRIKITGEITPYKEFDIMMDKPNVEMENALSEMNVQVIVELGRTTYTQKQLLAAKEGDIVEINKLNAEPLDVFANNVLFAKGEAVVIDDHFGIRIMEIIAGTENEDAAAEIVDSPDQAEGSEDEAAH